MDKSDKKIGIKSTFALLGVLTYGLYPFILFTKQLYDETIIDDSHIYNLIAVYYILSFLICSVMTYRNRYGYFEYAEQSIKKTGSVLMLLADVGLIIMTVLTLTIAVKSFNSATEGLIYWGGVSLRAGSSSRSLMGLLAGLLFIPAVGPLVFCHIVIISRQLTRN